MAEINVFGNKIEYFIAEYFYYFIIINSLREKKKDKQKTRGKDLILLMEILIIKIDF